MKYDIPVFQPKKVREPECIEELRKYNADVMVVVAFGQILPKEILEMTPYGCINVHASLLPKYRGAAPIQWAVIDGEEVSGVTTMQMNEGLDTGDMIMKTEIVLDEKETGGSLFHKLADAGAKLCVETLKALENKTATWEPQGETPTDYARMLNKELGNIKWESTAVQIERLIRGLNPWPSAYTDWNGKVMKIWEAEVVDKDTNEAPGTVVKVEKDGFYVQTGKGQIKVLALQIPGKKRMEADAFLRGYQIEENTVLK
jgi:methionyl-tRNA formyltransferase